MVFFYDAETYRGLTAPAPAPAPQSSRYPTQWPSFLKEIRQLYIKQNYKRCANQCERILQEQSGRLQPLHETFLNFYTAVSNESLALATHKFSSKKLSFLQLAKDFFTAALVSLPVPYTSHGSGSYEAPRVLLPHSPSLDRCRAHSEEEIDASQSSDLGLSISSRPTSDTKQSLDERCDSGYHSEPECLPLCSGKNVPDFNHYTPRRPLADLLSPTKSSTQPSPAEKDLIGVSLEEDCLIPQPLVIKKTSAVPADTSSYCQLLPLPLKTSGVQQHKTATNPPEAAPNAPPSTTSPDLQDQQPELSRAHVPSHSSTTIRYHTDLSHFRHQLSNHLSFIDRTIVTTTNLQQQHRLNQSKRVASFWSFQPVVNSAADDEEDSRTGEKKERIERLRQGGWNVTKERHGWKGEAFYEELRGHALAELRD